MREVDVLIIGQGLAGTFLSYWLLAEGIDVVVINQTTLYPASAAGTGVFNPIAGYRFTPFWNIHHCLSALQEAARAMEQFFHTSLLFDFPIFRFFIDEQQRLLWEERNLAEKLSDFIEGMLLPSDVSQWIDAPLGGFITRHSYLFHVDKALTLWQEFLQNHRAYTEARFSEETLQIHVKKILWNGTISARNLVYCTGESIRSSPYWKFLPFEYAKGEALTFYSRDLPHTIIFNRGYHWSPLEPSLFRFGATYRWDDASVFPTSEGYNQLCEALGKLCRSSYSIVAHHAGVRITFPDHLPGIGKHPEYPNLWLFTGLGTKGVGYAPYLGYLLSRALIENERIPREVSIERFF